MDGGCVISNVETNEKLGYFAPDNNPDVSFLDPTNTFSVSAYQTACGSVDIMSHIFDVAYFSKKQSMDMLLRIQEEVLKTFVKYAPMAVLYFLENHDEQRIASSFFAGEAQNGVPGLVVSALLQKNSLMIYFGQEYGEKGMDKEGFSGNDGRTTIFDYWSVDTIVRVAHQKLTSQEKQLKAIYDKVIDIATTEKAVGSGASFDLMYVNGQYNHEYAFIRKSGAEVLLVVANFADSNQTIGVTIPGHAFDFLNMKEKNAQATDLLSGEKQKLSLKRDEAVLVNVQAKSAVVLKFKA
jgi:glycosidase